MLDPCDPKNDHPALRNFNQINARILTFVDDDDDDNREQQPYIRIDDPLAILKFKKEDKKYDDFKGQEVKEDEETEEKKESNNFWNEFVNSKNVIEEKNIFDSLSNQTSNDLKHKAKNKRTEDLRVKKAELVEEEESEPNEGSKEPKSSFQESRKTKSVKTIRRKK